MRFAGYCIAVLSMLMLTGMGYAQEGSTPREVQGQDTVRQQELTLRPGMDTTGMNLQIDSIYVDEESFNRPKKAGYLSAVLPGLGQAYNNRFWKIPIIYGGLGTIGYFIGWNNNKYQQYRNAYLEKVSYPPELIDDPLALELSADQLQSGVDYYRRNRDFLMIVLVGVYVIQVLDSFIDAHLMEFDISDDLSLRLEPGFEAQSLYTSRQYGVKLTLNFN